MYFNSLLTFLREFYNEASFIEDASFNLLAYSFRCGFGFYSVNVVAVLGSVLGSREVGL